MKKTCLNCKWWGRHYEGACDKVGWTFRDDPMRFEVIVRADDDQGLDYLLRTGPDFGCVLFEQGDPKESDDNAEKN